MIISILIFFIVVFLIFVSEKPNCFIKTLTRFIEFFENKTEETENNYKFYDLSAEDGLEEKACGKLLKFGLENEKVLNIAVTGPYGSGKSSFLKSFERKYKNYNYLNISLASFSDDIGEDKNTKNKIEKIIEENILQQILYKESADNLPNSRIKRIKEISFFNLSVNFTLFYIWFNIFYIRFKKEAWKEYESVFLDFEEGKWKIILSLILLGGIFYFVYSLARNFGINKITIKAFDNEIELGNNKETSVFYKYLDEIIYFFKKTKYDVVFFEDIDRFENITVDLFTKLRELNSLLNSSSDIKRNIKFIYAVKDDLFESEIEKQENEKVVKMRKEDSHKLRTKFFDLIVPIIPVINYSNSKEKLWEKLWDNYLQEKYQNKIKLLEEEKQKNQDNNDGKEKIRNIDLEIENLKKEGIKLQEWIKKFALYIDDMRLINNIVNEFIVYRENLNKNVSKEKLDDVKMIAFIIYKNLYPKDFSDLHIKKGLVYEGLKAKETYINRINSKILKLKGNLIGVDEELFSDLESLRLYLLNKTLSDNNIVMIGNQSILHIIKNESVFLNLNNHYNNIRHCDGSVKQSIYLNFDLKEYTERKSIIEMKSEENKNKIILEIENLKGKSSEVDKYSIKSLCRNNDASEFFTSKLINEPFLVYLIEQGIIDEKEYYRYLSYFYKGDLSPNDRDFLIALRGRKNGIEDYKLDNPKNVIDELHVEDFERKEILNYNLMDEIIENSNKYKQQFIAIFTMINNEINRILEKKSDENKIINFFKEYFLKTTIKDISIEEIIKKVPEFWELIYFIKGHLTDENIEDIFLEVFEYSKLEDIKIQNKSLGISKYFYKKENSLEILSRMYKINEKKAEEFIGKLEIVVNKVNIENISSRALNVDYTFNIKNIRKVAQFYCNNDERIMSNFEIKNYSSMRNNEELWSLEQSVNSRFNEYLENVFLKLDSNTKEDLNRLLTILNEYDDEFQEKMDFKLSLEQKEKVIKKQECIYPEIALITNKELWRVVFNENKIFATWENVLRYFKYCDEQIDNSLIKYLNNSENILELSKIKLADVKINDDDKLSKVLGREIMLSKEIEDNNFKIILNSLYSWSSIDYVEKEEKEFYSKLFNLMNEEEKLDFIKKFDMENLTVNDSLYPLLKECIETIKDFNIFNLKKVKEWDTNSLLPFSNNVILILNKIYGDKIEIEGYFDYHKRKIVENIKELDLTARNYEILFDVLSSNKDKFKLINNLKEEAFENYSFLEKIFDFIEEEENEKIESIILKKLMLKSSKENQLDLFLKQLDFLSTSEIKTILIALEGNYKKIVDNPTRNTFNENDVNIEILNKLKEKGIFSTVSGKNNKITVIKNQDLKW